MKILLFSDPHFCEKASIISSIGRKYSVRLENLLKSINWAEDVATQNNCDLVICLGDFFDQPQLTDQELTALNDIKWANIKHYFLVGNHESEEVNLQYNSTKAVEKANNKIISSPTTIKLDNDTELAFLPYIHERIKKPLAEYFGPKTNKKRIILSHNDLLGVQLGPVVSTTGFDPDELANISDLCLNGHLHNSAKVNNKVINLGNLTGKDFGENAFKYKHCVMILDTDTLEYKLIENPYAFNFYKIEINDRSDFAKLDSLKQNAAVIIKCKEQFVQDIRAQISSSLNIVEFRIITVRDVEVGNTNLLDTADLSIVPDEKFEQFCDEFFGNDELTKFEVHKILEALQKAGSSFSNLS